MGRRGSQRHPLLKGSTWSLYPSTHEMPLFPGTGALSERGEYDQIVNVPLHAGNTGEVFREAMEIAILPRLVDFAPDLVIISAGFHGPRCDPLGNLNLVEADYVWITAPTDGGRAKALRRAHRVVLEGGYEFESLAGSVGAHVMR
jgi:acetoin utilization deacetylase AcuC-like enzyme